MTDDAAIAEALELVRSGHGFEAHELLEDLWRAAATEERDLYQGLVHVAVATYQESRGNRVGRYRQLEKAVRRLGPYGPAHAGLDVAAVLAWCRASLAADRCPPLPGPWPSRDADGRPRPPGGSGAGEDAETSPTEGTAR